MEHIEITVTGRKAVMTVSAPLVVGTVGLPVKFIFDESWQGLKKTAVFRVGRTIMSCLDIEKAVVPWELLKTKGCTVLIGVYGTNADGTEQIPTVWANAGNIVPGAEPSQDESADPTLPVWQQSAAMLEQAIKRGDFNGKSAYQTAVEGGYKGTQAEFAKKLAKDTVGVFSVHVDVDINKFSTNNMTPVDGQSKHTYWDIKAACDAGNIVFCEADHIMMTLTSITDTTASFLGTKEGFDFVVSFYEDPHIGVKVIPTYWYLSRGDLPTTVSSFTNDAGYVTNDVLEDTVGNIETALDSIISIQEDLIGGDAV